MAKTDIYWVNDDYFERRVWRPEGRFNIIQGAVTIVVLAVIFSLANYYAGWIHFLPIEGKHPGGPGFAGWNVGFLSLFIGGFWLFQRGSQRIVLKLWGAASEDVTLRWRETASLGGGALSVKQPDEHWLSRWALISALIFPLTILAVLTTLWILSYGASLDFGVYLALAAASIESLAGAGYVVVLARKPNGTLVKRLPRGALEFYQPKPTVPGH